MNPRITITERTEPYPSTVRYAVFVDQCMIYEARTRENAERLARLLSTRSNQRLDREVLNSADYNDRKARA